MFLFLNGIYNFHENIMGFDEIHDLRWIRFNFLNSMDIKDGISSNFHGIHLVHPRRHRSRRPCPNAPEAVPWWCPGLCAVQDASGTR